MEAALKIDSPGQEFSEPKVKENLVMGLLNNYEVDMSDGVAIDMFGISPSNDNEVNFYLLSFIILVVKFSYTDVIFFSFLLREFVKNSTQHM